MIAAKITCDTSKLDRAIGLLGRDVMAKNVFKPALNDSIKKARTLIKTAILTRYNFPLKRVMDDKLGLRLKLATANNLRADVSASNKPVNIADVKLDFKSQVIGHTLKRSVRAQKKGVIKLVKAGTMRRSISRITPYIYTDTSLAIQFKSAFIPGRFSYKAKGDDRTLGGSSSQAATPAVFRRGKYIKGGHFVGMIGGRFPITALRTTSIGTAAATAKTQRVYRNEVNKYSRMRFIHHVELQLKKIGETY